MVKPSLVLAVSALCLASGCRTLGPDHKTPVPALPESYATPGSATALPLPDGSWWSLYQDATLDRLITQSLSHNASLAVSLARIEEARARLGVAESDQLPQLSTDPSASYSQTALRRNGPGANRQKGQNYRLPFTLGYELDLWGRVKRSVESANASLEATELDRAALRLVVSGEVARTYFTWRGLLAEAEVLLRNRNNRAEALRLNEARLKAGLVGELDVARARQELAAVEAEQEDVRRRADLARNALAFLCGDHVSGLPAHVAPLTGLPPEVPAGLPSELLLRRPDIAASEKRAHAACAAIGVARSAAYPSVELTAAAGLESFKLSRLLREPSQFWSFGPSVHLPLFDGGRNKANALAAEAAHRATLESHRETVLRALAEVEDSLIEIRARAAQHAAQGRTREASTRVAELSRLRYDKGLINYFEVNDSERSLLQVERAQAHLLAARFTASVQLLQALGGGWKQAAPAPSPTAK